MNTSSLLLGILPLLIFVIVDTFCNVKTALIVAVIFALIEAIYTYVVFGELDIVTGLSFGLLLVLGCTSFYKKDSIYFKFQPVILSIFFGIYLFYSYYINEPLFVMMVNKYHNLLPQQQAESLKLPIMQILLSKSTLTASGGLILHGVLTGVAALKLSNWWWLIFRGVGFYLFLFLSFFCARLLI